MDETPARLTWQEARVTRIGVETPRVKSFRLEPAAWAGFTAGQHVDVRLTAPDGYQAERSYSIASAPEDAGVELTIEKLDDGEVSPFFHEVVEIGDAIEMRGPIGGHFNWGKADGGPIALFGGGSGVVPLMSIVRHRMTVAPDVPALLVYSARTADDVIFRDELAERTGRDPNLHVVVTLTRESTPHPGYHMGRLDGALTGAALAQLGAPPRHTYVCGATAFVDTATRLLIDAGVPFGSIKTERYGGAPAGDDAGAALTNV